MNSEDRSTTASSSSYALKTSCYPEQPYGGEHYLEGRYCTGARSNTGKVYCRGADSDNSKVADNSGANTGEVYRRGTDTDTIKRRASTPAYSVKGYNYSTVARTKPNAN